MKFFFFLTFFFYIKTSFDFMSFICKNFTDCFNCSLTTYEFAQCKWDSKSHSCYSKKLSSSYSAVINYRQIYTLCISDPSIQTTVETYCGEIKNKSIDSKHNIATMKVFIPFFTINNTKIYSITNLLCRYSITNNFNTFESIFSLNVTKNFNYLFIGIEYNYGYYIRYEKIGDKENDYNNSLPGVKEVNIFVYTPEQYLNIPFDITYQMIEDKFDFFMKFTIYVFFFFDFIFIVIFIMLFLFNKRNFNNKRKFLHDISFTLRKFFEEYYKNSKNNVCPVCNKKFINFENITVLQCKHIYHYDCIIKWVNRNNLNKNNFFCMECQNDLIISFNKKNNINIDFVNDESGINESVFSSEHKNLI